ncbi:TonB-dependent receptor [uncultured Eudoraea sp.]|uniref:TonB-dependent receptor n=1 Tax=uncultured Eudoraea sp. TaxID=1035614 RepID=UPI002617CCE1|nr:TonB-dependent receptor [uncultured Eudoraea sp.]
MRNKLILLFNIITLLSCALSFGQQTEVNKPLVSILTELQERYQVQFNYASELIEDLQLLQPRENLELKEVIDYLKVQTGLDFVFVSESVISITSRPLKLCGYIRDKDTQEPLSYTTVQSNGRGTVSDDEGYFELPMTKISDVVLIRHIGHRTLRRELRFFNTRECAIIYLVSEQEQLPEIILSDYLIKGMDRLDNGSFQLNFDQFSILPGLVEEDVLRSVQALPGIQSIDETVSNINIRGGSNDQNLILWDGIKMYQSGHFFGLISMYNPHITQKVALQKNGSSAAYTDGVSGTIAMSSDKKINPDTNGSISINLIDANGYIDIPLGEKASIQVAARKSISDFFETPTYAEYFDRITQDTEISANVDTITNSDIKFDFYDASFRLLVQPTEKDFVRLNFIYTANQVVFNESALVNDSEEIRESNLDQNSIAGSLFYRRKWNPNMITEFSIYETDYKLKAINSNVLQQQRFLQENVVSETGVRAVARNKMFENFEWRNGYHFVETKITNLDDVDDPIFRRLESKVLRTHGIFSEIDWSTPDNNTSVNAGLRFNYLEKFGKQIWEPRLSFNQKFLQWFNVEILGEFKHQNTSQVINFQSDFLGLEKRRWQLSNDDDIPIIQSKQASLGLSYEQYNWLVHAVGFFKEVNGITTQSQGFQDSYEFVKTAGQYDAYGMEFLLRKQIQNWNIWLSYGYLNSKYIFEELPEPEFRSNFDIEHAVSSGLTFSTKKLLMAAGLNWRTGKPFTPTVPGNEIADGAINYDAVNSDQLDDYLRLDISTTYTTPIGNKTDLQAGISIWNLLNKKNIINTFFRLDDLDNAQQVNQNSLGITPNAILKFIFH